MSANIIRRAFQNDDPIVVEEIAKDARLKYLGTTSIDLYVHTSKSYVAKKIEGNILAIKDAIFELENKNVRDVYINNVKHELIINELNSKQDIGLINLKTLNIDKTNEMSGENDIVDELFEYEMSVLTKSKVMLHMYQKTMNREWKEEISMSLIRSRFSFKKKTLVKRLKELISLKYEPNNNDTKEIIELLGLK